MILDSSFLIELLRGTDAAFQRGASLADAGRPQRIPAPVLYELRYGVEMTGSENERRAVENLETLYPVVETTAALAGRAARLVAAADRDAGGVDRAGIDDVDPFVAAVAEAVDEPVLTMDVEDFRTLGVAVESF